MQKGEEEISFVIPITSLNFCHLYDIYFLMTRGKGTRLDCYLLYETNMNFSNQLWEGQYCRSTAYPWGRICKQQLRGKKEREKGILDFQTLPTSKICEQGRIS